MEENIECGGFTFLNNFDSANLAKVDKVDKVEINKADNGKSENNKSHKSSPPSEPPRYEFNLWTKHDCHGTEFQDNNKTWFYFGIKAAMPGVIVKLNLVNLNKQVKMFSQGMCPVFKVLPGHPQWERIKEKPSFTADDKNNEFVLSFNYRTSENSNAVTYFAFTYPFSYTDLQNYLKKIDAKMSKQTAHFSDDIYYHRECAIKSLEGRRLDVLTISSYYNILYEREDKLKDLFTEENEERPFKFQDKKIIFISARVHPGETPSSFVLNGFLNFLLNREDQIAITLRRLYVFKLIPMLNPDGVAQGYYRMDTRGVNLNRLYLNPSKLDHPTIFAANTLLRYYHNSYNLPEDNVPEINKESVKEIIKKDISTFDTETSINTIQSISKETNKLLQRVTLMSLEEKNKCIEQGSRMRNYLIQASEKSILKNQELSENEPNAIENMEKVCSTESIKECSQRPEDSGMFLYIDFHGHASKKGIFMYGNHFHDPEDSAACMLLPKLMSINNPNFHFTSCNFAEKNMYLIDKRDGMSREGSGRVAVYKLTGLIHSYTLECNYNTGRLVNSVPARVKDGLHKGHGQVFVPPKYSPAVFEEVGAAFGPSILDMTGSNPNSRLPNSQYRSLKGLKSYLKLISANHFQTSLNKPLHKNSSSDQIRYFQDSASDEIVDKPSKHSSASALNSALRNDAKLQLPDNPCKIFRTANIYGTIKMIKSNKKPHQAISWKAQKFVAGSKISSPSTHKKIGPIANQLAKKAKTMERNPRAKLPVKNSTKKSMLFAKKAVVKKGPPKLKAVATIAKVRHKFQIELAESSKKNTAKIATTMHSKQKSKSSLQNKVTVNNKKQSAKLENKSPKKSSISKI